MNMTNGSGGQQVKLAQAETSAGERSVDSAVDVSPAVSMPQVDSAKAIESAPAVQANDESRTGTVEPLPGGESPVALPAADLRKSVERPGAGEKTTEITPPATAEPVNGDEFVKPAPTIEAPKPAAPPRTKAADQPAKRSGQVAVFVSRKEKKIFVRQGMVPLFDMPITIEDPDQPLGTHVFTFLSGTDEAPRWNLMTIPTDAGYVSDYPRRRRGKEPPVVETKPLKAASTAAEALDRIQFPKEAAERISELLIPGSSLVVSDDGLGRETGRGTEFIVLTR